MQAAIHSLKSRRDDEEGFTLIELMVVVLIIAILIAIAIPTFLGARERAQDRAAQSDLRNGLVAAKTFYTDNETYVGFDNAALILIEPSLASALNHATRPLVLSGQAANAVVLTRTSASGDEFSICETATGTKYGVGAASETSCNLDEW